LSKNGFNLEAWWA